MRMYTNGLIYIYILFCVFSVVRCPAKTVLLTATSDSEVKDWDPDASFPNDIDLTSVQVLGTPDTFSYAFMQFKLPSDCDPGTITSVLFKRVLTAVSGSTHAGYVCIITDNAMESTTVNNYTWNNAPGIGRNPLFNNTIATHYDPAQAIWCGYSNWTSTAGEEYIYDPCNVASYWDNLKSALDGDNNGILTFFWTSRYYPNADSFASIENPTYHGPQLEITYPSNGNGLDVTLEESDGDTIVHEQGETSDTYTMVLAEIPEEDVQITITGDGFTIVDIANITFDPNNWDVPRTITVTAIDDQIDQPFETYHSVITHTAFSLDPYYNNIAIPDITVSVYDNEVHCGDYGYLPADINQDCYLDMLDLHSLASEWLTCTDPTDPVNCELTLE